MDSLEVEITGNNVDTIFTLLRLGPGDEGFRDGLLQAAGPDLISYGMVRLNTDVEATGDDRTSAAPVGRILADQRRQYPGLGGGMVSVQVEVGITGLGTRRCWVSFRRSVAKAGSLRE
ncbi:MAG: hypothetical protein O2943_06995 [Actinomycetota bacterium]|nr:hypothetical protein [Actinomycetota bacterium]